eukprot:571654-Prymnesium_polylepis.1
MQVFGWLVTGTSRDRITGRLEVRNAHSATAFATSSNATLVVKVCPCVTMGTLLRPSQQSICHTGVGLDAQSPENGRLECESVCVPTSTCRKPWSSCRLYMSALLRPVS